MATTIFTPSMLRNGTRATPEIEGGGGGGFSNTKSFYNFNSGGDTNLPATANLGDLSYLRATALITYLHRKLWGFILIGGPTTS